VGDGAERSESQVEAVVVDGRISQLGADLLRLSPSSLLLPCTTATQRRRSPYHVCRLIISLIDFKLTHSYPSLQPGRTCFFTPSIIQLPRRSFSCAFPSLPAHYNPRVSTDTLLLLVLSSGDKGGFDERRTFCFNSRELTSSVSSLRRRLLVPALEP